MHCIAYEDDYVLCPAMLTSSPGVQAPSSPQTTLRESRENAPEQVALLVSSAHFVVARDKVGINERRRTRNMVCLSMMSMAIHLIIMLEVDVDPNM